MNDPTPPTISDDPLTAFFWEGARQGELRIQRCRRCGTYIHLPRPVCRACRSFDLAGEAVSGRATLYSYTVTHKAFHPFFVERVPYMVATVELAEQAHLHLLTQLVDVDEGDVRIGMPLSVGFQQLGDDLVVPVFSAEVTS